MQNLAVTNRSGFPNVTFRPKVVFVGEEGQAFHFKNHAARAKSQRALDALKEEKAGEALTKDEVAKIMAPYYKVVTVYRGVDNRVYREHTYQQRRKANAESV